MADVFTKAKRSEVMSRIRSRGNRDTELAMARLLRAAGIRGWRRQVQIGGRAALLRGQKNQAAQQRRPTKNQRTGRPFVAKAMQGRRSVPTFRVKPDFVFPKLKLALFVDGCFWHGCPKHATWPTHRAAWWRRKIEGNKTRDRVVNRALRRAGRVKWRGHHAVGWRVLRIWECELRNTERILKRIEKHLK